MSNDEVLAIRYGVLFGVPLAIVSGVAIEVLKGRPLRWVAAGGIGTSLLLVALGLASWRYLWGFVPLAVIAIGVRQFLLRTDLNVGYGYHYRAGSGWMPHFDIRSSPSARQHILLGVNSKRRRKVFGISFEELIGFDRTLNETIIYPGTTNRFSNSGPIFTGGPPGFSNPPKPAEMQELAKSLNGVRLFVDTKVGYEYEGSGPHNVRGLGKERLYRIRGWLDKYHI